MMIMIIIALFPPRLTLGNTPLLWGCGERGTILLFSSEGGTLLISDGMNE